MAYLDFPTAPAGRAVAVSARRVPIARTPPRPVRRSFVVVLAPLVVALLAMAIGVATARALDSGLLGTIAAGLAALVLIALGGLAQPVARRSISNI